MTNFTAIAIAHPNIAFIKYWGNRDDALRLPQNGSISMNLAELDTRTTVSFNPSLRSDYLTLNGTTVTGAGLQRVSAMLDLVRQQASRPMFAEVVSANSFPTGAGIASSASAFAALALAASTAVGLQLDQVALSRLARRGSGSACRSIPAGFTEWHTGTQDSDSYAISIALENHWALTDCVAVVESGHKPTGSTQGHALANTSSLQAARVTGAPARLERCRQAILRRDFGALADVAELDSNLMHAVMMTSQPMLMYWSPATLEIMRQVSAWRRAGLPACYTIDAGANVHVICPSESAQEVEKRLRDLPSVSAVLTSTVGGPARLVYTENR